MKVDSSLGVFNVLSWMSEYRGPYWEGLLYTNGEEFAAQAWQEAPAEHVF